MFWHLTVLMFKDLAFKKFECLKFLVFNDIITIECCSLKITFKFSAFLGLPHYVLA